MAKKTMFVSDLSGAEIEDGKGATARVQFSDARIAPLELDLTAEEAQNLFGDKARKVKRRGRKPKAAA